MQTTFLLFMRPKSISYSTHIFPSHTKSISIPEIIKMNHSPNTKPPILTIMQKGCLTFPHLGKGRQFVAAFRINTLYISNFSSDLWCVLYFDGQSIYHKICPFIRRGYGRCFVESRHDIGPAFTADIIGCLFISCHGLLVLYDGTSTLLWRQTFEQVRKSKQRPHRLSVGIIGLAYMCPYWKLHDFGQIGAEWRVYPW
jgi:hypothetical protein